EFGAECLTLTHIGDGLLQRRLPAAERAGADVETAAVEAGHGDLESLARLAKEVLLGHAHGLHGHLPGRPSAPAHLLFVRAESQTLHALLEHEDGDPPGAVPARTGHDEVGLRGSGAGAALLGPVEDI